MLSLVSCSLALTPAPTPLVRNQQQGLTRQDLAHCTSRRTVLSSAFALSVLPAPSFAGYVTSLGIETTKPQDAEKDDELLSTKEVQNGLSAVRAYRQTASKLASQFEADPNMPLIPALRKEFDFSKLRSELNVVTTVFDDTTQGTTDRVIRAILYDLTELETAARLKKGETERTPKKIANVNKWFVKLDKDFDDLLAYYK